MPSILSPQAVRAIARRLLLEFGPEQAAQNVAPAVRAEAGGSLTMLRLTAWSDAVHEALLIEVISDARKKLAEQIDFEEYSNARASMRQLSDALERLSEKINATEDADERNVLVDLHTAAREQWLDANQKLREAGEEWL